ncbi:MAG: M28 family peptidase, partial [Candidatus Acidiferrales bacterium]
GFYNVVTATIPGADAALRGEEIAFSCHLDHPRPGANDNASGCVTILEVARTFAKLIREGKLAPPKRTLRFIWPPEIEGTLALLHARPELAGRIKAVVHMDMVGGGPETKAIFHVTRGPASLPSFVNDVAEAYGEFVNRQSAALASGGNPPYALVAPEGGKEALQADLSRLTLGSDHQIYTDSSFSIPAIYLNDWPDRYIHTNFDAPANIDPTKLKRAGFIGAASAYFLANAGVADAEALWALVQSRSLKRTAAMLERRERLDAAEAASLTRFHFWHERAMVDSLERFFPVPDGIRHGADEFFSRLEMLTGGGSPTAAAKGEGALVFRRNPGVKGPVSVFGYDYLEDHYGRERAEALRLPKYRGLFGSGGEYAYEALNLADGRRTAQEIRDALAAIYGPVPLELVVEYLKALEEIKLVERVSP